MTETHTWFAPFAPQEPTAPEDPRLERAFARIADSDLRAGNKVSLLRNAEENYPAWLDALRKAERVIHFENYIIADDKTGRDFAAILKERARAGVRVRVLYDWLGSYTRASRRFWHDLREAGIEVRVFNPLRLTNPFFLRRNHRKLITVDGRIGFVSGLCVSDSWQGNSHADPWRDTGLSLEGPVVADLDAAFADSWAFAGPPLKREECAAASDIPAAGTTNARVICGQPGMFRAYRVDQFIAATAKRNIWIADAYLVPTTAYVQALGEAAQDGVDVRLLVPGSTDSPLLQPFVRAGYRSLIEAGVRVFEWNGAMLHAKSAVVDGHWARVGSTNLNIASWATNWELDVVVEDKTIAEAMEAMYLEDLKQATEVVPGSVTRRRQERNALSRRSGRARRGAVGRLAAGAVALGSSIGRDSGGLRSLTATEAGSVATIGAMLLALAALVIVFPPLIILPVTLLLGWFGAALLIRSLRLRQRIRIMRHRWERRNAGRSQNSSRM
ncbi:phospholipase D-like domain-containing protein [Microvirga flavescens]|uniref:phospholipase D-like domain-containing protein n=1 Tax=Microvirga flavescens TaxID=2249811 RepID=UPI000DDBFA9C|nr:phospholipase D-like domain-containing protein [Microvirga flavescens]